jgi:hypothetical protein
MRRRAKLAVITTTALLLLIFASLPWWLEVLVGATLPEKIEAFQADINYPEFSQISADSIRFAISDTNTSMEISHLSSNYGLTQLAIGEVNISTSATVPSETDRGDLEARINPIESGFRNLLAVLDALNAYSEFKQLSVNRLAIKIASANTNGWQQVTFDNVLLNRNGNVISFVANGVLDNNVAESLILKGHHVSSPMEFKIIAELEKRGLKVEINSSNDTLFGLSFSTDNKLQKLRIAANTALLNQLLKQAEIKDIYFTSEKVELNLLKNMASEKIHLASSTELLIGRDWVEEWFQTTEPPVQLLEQVKAQAKADLVIGTSNQCSESKLCQLQLAINIPNSVSVQRNKNKIDFSGMAVTIITKIKLNQIWPTNDIFAIYDTSINSKIDRVFVENTLLGKVKNPARRIAKLEHEVSPTSARIDSVNIKLGLANQPVTVKQFLAENWRVDGYLSASQFEVVATSKSSTIPAKSESDTEPLSFKGVAPLEIEFNLINDSKLESNGVLALEQFEFHSKDSAAKGKLDLKWKNANLEFTKGEVSTTVNLLTPKYTDFSFEQAAMIATMDASESDFKGAVTLSFNQRPMAPFNFQFNRKHQSFAMQLKKEKVSLELINHFLSTIGQKNKIPLQILSGSLTHSGDAKLAKSILISSQLNANKVDLLFGENNVIGLNIDQLVTSLNPKLFKTKLDMARVEFSSGLKIENIKTNIEGRLVDSKEQIELTQLHANILAGELYSESIVFNELELRPTEVNLYKVSLAKLFEFMDVGGLVAEGSIDIVLPVSSSDGKLVIENGKFESIGTGRIQYDVGDEVEQQNIALQVLQNFHYQSFDGSISYDKHGDYLIKLHLLGSNPDFYDGYPVDFMLNLNGQITGLFRSLFLTGNFEQAVLQQIEAERMQNQE